MYSWRLLQVIEKSCFVLSFEVDNNLKTFVRAVRSGLVPLQEEKKTGRTVQLKFRRMETCGMVELFFN